jgi:hypothetical protein
MRTRAFGQSPEDGAMPLLSAEFMPSDSGTHWHPSKRMGWVGSTKNEALEVLSTASAPAKLMRETSEEAW